MSENQLNITFNQKSFSDNLPQEVNESIASQLDVITQELQNASYKVKFLFGAGMSRPSDFKDFKSLTKKLLAYVNRVKENILTEEELDKLVSMYPFELIIQSVELFFNRETLRDFLSEEYLDDTKEPNRAHEYFVKICNHLNNNLNKSYDSNVRFPGSILTTNFDILFEKIFRSPIQIHLDNFEDSNIPSNHIPIKHLHGILKKSIYKDNKWTHEDFGSTYVITESDIFSSNPKNKYFIQTFINELTESNIFVFVGYSLNDPDLKEAFREFLRAKKENYLFQKNKIFVVSPCLNEIEYKLSSDVWKARGAIYIPYSGEQFFKGVFDLLVEKDLVTLRKKLSDKRGIRNEVELGELIDYTKSILFYDNDKTAIKFLLETV